MASAKTDLLSVPLALDAVGWGGVGDAFLTADMPQVYVQGLRTSRKPAKVCAETYPLGGSDSQFFVLQRPKPHLPDTLDSPPVRGLVDIYRHTSRTATTLAGQDCHSYRTAAPHLADAIATVAGPKFR